MPTTASEAWYVVGVIAASIVALAAVPFTYAVVRTMIAVRSMEVLLAGDLGSEGLVQTVKTLRARSHALGGTAQDHENRLSSLEEWRKGKEPR